MPLGRILSKLLNLKSTKSQVFFFFNHSFVDLESQETIQLTTLRSRPSVVYFEVMRTSFAFFTITQMNVSKVQHAQE